MREMKIKFIDVGRNNATWEAECKAEKIEDLEYEWLYSQVKKRAMVMSKEIDFLISRDDNTSGIITAGLRNIGKFTILQDHQTEKGGGSDA